MAQGLLLGWMAWTWKVETYLILSPIIGYGMLGMLGLWSWRYGTAMGRNARSDNMGMPSKTAGLTGNQLPQSLSQNQQLL